MPVLLNFYPHMRIKVFSLYYKNISVAQEESGMKTTIKVNESEDFRKAAIAAIYEEMTTEIDWRYFVTPVDWVIHRRWDWDSQWCEPGDPSRSPWWEDKIALPLWRLCPKSIKIMDEPGDRHSDIDYIKKNFLDEIVIRYDLL